MSRDKSWRSEVHPYGLEIGVGTAAFVGASALYYVVEYLPTSERIHDDREATAKLESDASSFIITRDALAGQDMLVFGQDFYLTETAASMRGEAQVIREETPSQGIEQLQVMGVGLGVGALAFAACLIGRNIFHKIKDPRPTKKYDDFLSSPEHKKVMQGHADTVNRHKGDDDFTPPPAA